MSEQIQILLTVLDEASATIADASTKIKASLGNVENAVVGARGSYVFCVFRTNKDRKTGQMELHNAPDNGWSLRNSVDNQKYPIRQELPL